MFKQKFAWRKRSTMTIVDRSESPNFRVRVAQMLSKRRAILLHSTCRGSAGMLGCGGYLTSRGSDCAGRLESSETDVCGQSFIGSDASCGPQRACGD
jgi:hypothetical protein